MLGNVYALNVLIHCYFFSDSDGWTTFFIRVFELAVADYFRPILIELIKILCIQLGILG